MKSGVTFWATLALILQAAGLLARVQFRDRGHGSFLTPPMSNPIVRCVPGALTLTPIQICLRAGAQNQASAGT